MVDPTLLEESYQRYMSNLGRWIPDGVIQVDLEFLQSLGMMCCRTGLGSAVGSDIKEFFHVLESDEKITLWNRRFVIWIAPQVFHRRSCTLAIIASRTSDLERPEMAFLTTGVYNTSRTVLKIVETLLEDIQETDDLVVQMRHQLGDDLEELPEDLEA